MRTCTRQQLLGGDALHPWNSGGYRKKIALINLTRTPVRKTCAQAPSERRQRREIATPGERRQRQVREGNAKWEMATPSERWQRQVRDGNAKWEQQENKHGRFNHSLFCMPITGRCCNFTRSFVRACKNGRWTNTAMVRRVLCGTSTAVYCEGSARAVHPYRNTGCREKIRQIGFS